jgi:nitrogen regulatory protein P-II 1
MSTDNEMTIVTALIRPHMEARVVRALHNLPEFPGFFLTETRGQGRGKGAGGAYTATEFDLTYHRFLQLQTVCRSDMANKICDMIAAAAWTGLKGDGIIFTTDAHSFVRIREVGGPKHQVSR